MRLVTDGGKATHDLLEAVDSALVVVEEDVQSAAQRIFRDVQLRVTDDQRSVSMVAKARSYCSALM